MKEGLEDPRGESRAGTCWEKSVLGTEAELQQQKDADNSRTDAQPYKLSSCTYTGQNMVAMEPTCHHPHGAPHQAHD